jgi:hypothetical protein
MSEYAIVIAISAISTIVGVTIGLFIGSSGVAKDGEKAAIQHGAAHYDPKSGEFTWNDEGKTP